MKIVVENIFMCLVLFWKCYFLTNFSHFLGYFLSIQTNFITKNFKITAKSQHHTPPKLQWRPTAANSDNQKPQPPKLHYHTTTTTKIKITERDRWVKGEIARRRDWRRDRAARDRRRDQVARSSGAVLRLARCAVRSARSSECNRRTGARGSPATSNAWSRLSLSLSLYSSDPEMVWSENLSFKPFPWSKPHFTQSTSNNFRKIYFPCATKHPHLRKSISRSGLKSKQTQP